MVRFKHPAYELDRGVPSRATVGTDDYEIDDEGYLSIDDEATAARAMDTLASTYGVSYDDDGEIEGESAPDTPGSDGEDGDAEAEADESDGSDDGADEALSQDELQALGRDELRERCRDTDDVDVGQINLNQTDEMVAALMRAQTEAVDGEGDG
jgi:hypothetical protein